MDLETGAPLEGIAVVEMHKDCLARRRGPANKDNAMIENLVTKTSNHD